MFFLSERVYPLNVSRLSERMSPFMSIITILGRMFNCLSWMQGLSGENCWHVVLMFGFSGCLSDALLSKGGYLLNER